MPAPDAATDRPPSLFRLALVLGLMSAAGPLAIDMYLPAMPEIGRALAATPAGVQATLGAYFVAFGISQLAWGPWADAVGRRRPLALGLGVFLLGSLGAAVAPSIETLVAARFVQGLGGAVLMVVPRAVIRDLHTGPEAARLMALVMLVISVSPMLAPLGGSLIAAAAGWRAIFAVLAVVAAASLVLVVRSLPETLAPAARRAVSARALAAGARVLLTDRGFVGLTLLGAFGFASFFVFLAAAPFVYTQSFGLGPTGFSLAFALNAIGFFAASQAAGPLGARIGMARVLALGTLGFAALAAVLLGVGLAGLASLPVTVALLLAMNAFLGLLLPTAMVLALDDHGDLAGLASSLGGAIQMLVGAAAAALAGPWFDGSPLPMLAAIAATAGLALLVAPLALGRRATAYPSL